MCRGYHAPWSRPQIATGIKTSLSESSMSIKRLVIIVSHYVIILRFVSERTNAMWG